jgi:hypothetical protein
MKKTIFLVLAAAACIGLLLTACPTESKPTKYTVSFNINAPTGGTVAFATGQGGNRTVEKGKAIGALPTITSTTHEIDKWTSGQAATTATVSATTAVTGNMTVYAQWKTIGSGPGTNYTVTFDMNLGTGANAVTGASAKPANATVASGGTLGTNMPQSPTSTSHNFTKWTITTGGTGDFSATTPVTANITVSAQWTVKDAPGTNYTVTFDMNLGTGANAVTGASAKPANATVASGANLGANMPAAPTSTSHDFTKWTITTGGSGDFTSTTNVVANITVSAQWTVKTGPGPGDGVTASVTVGGTAQTVTITTGAGATATAITDGFRVVAPGGYGRNASFKVDLGAKTLKDFKEVTFGYTAGVGDTGYKNIWLLASDEAIPANVDTGNWYQNSAVSAVRWSKAGGSSEAQTATMGRLTAETTTYIRELPSFTGEIYFSIYLHAAGSANGADTTYELTNITFVPADAYTPVTSIIGVPSTGAKDVEVDLTVANVLPVYATNRTVTWAVTEAGAGMVIGAITGGKFNPTAGGEVKVTATVANGLTAATPYTQQFTIVIAGGAAEEKEIPLALPDGYSDEEDDDWGQLGAGYTGTLDSDGLGFSVTGGVNYNWAYAVFDLDLGTGHTFADVTKVTFTYTPVSGDTGWKDFFLFAHETLPSSGRLPKGPENDAPDNPNYQVGMVHFTDPAGGITLEFEIDYDIAKEITGSKVQIGFNLHATSPGGTPSAVTAFNISDIKFWVTEE